MALLDSDKKLVEKFGITPEHEPSQEEKLNFIEEQLGSMRTMLWRSRVDTMLNRALTPKNDDEADAIQQKIREHEKEVEKFAEATALMVQLRDEL